MQQIRWRRRALLALTAGMIFTMVVSAGALAVSTDGTFEYADGNSGATAPHVDWNDVYEDYSAGTLINSEMDVISFTDDPDYTRETSLFTGGSKDILDIDEWAWRTVGQAPDKTDLRHVMSAKKGNILYFAADRYATNGDAKVGFWILRGQIATESDGTFSGAHQDGDVMIESTFTDGGKNILTVNVYRWTDGIGLEPMGVEGGDCREDEPDWVVCATNNSMMFAPAWDYSQKRANKLPGGAFIEGAVDLSAIYGEEIPCFGSFLAETRAAGSSINSELKDFTLAPFDTCGSLTVRKVRNAGSPDATFDFTTGGTLDPDTFSLHGSTSDGTFDETSEITFDQLQPDTYTVTELEPAEPWVLTNIVCTGGTTSTDGTATATVTIVGSEDVTCTFYNFYNVVTTRTQGFWQTHPSLAKGEWGASREMCGLTVDATAPDEDDKGALMGGFWANVASDSFGTKRSALNKAKMTLLQQLLAAKLNQTKWPPSDPIPARIATAEERFCTSTSIHDVNTSATQMGAYNESGDTGIWSPGERANAVYAKGNADVGFWDFLGRNNWPASVMAAPLRGQTTTATTTESTGSSSLTGRSVHGKALAKGKAITR